MPMAATRADLLRNGDAAGDGFRCREAALGGNRGYLRFRVGVQDTFGLRVWLVHQAAPHPRAKRPELPKRFQ